jgi:hypothetical protein
MSKPLSTIDVSDTRSNSVYEDSSELLATVSAGSFSPSSQSNEPLELDMSAQKMAETLVTNARHEHHDRVWGIRLDDKKPVSKCGTEDWSHYTIAAGHVLGNLSLDIPSAAQIYEGGEGFKQAAVNNIANELAGQTVEVRATREDQQPPRGREYRRVEIRFVDGAGTTQLERTD